MKTAMQELIENLNKEANFINENDSYGDRMWKKGVIGSIKIISETFLEKEKKQIIEAYKQGCKNPSVFRENGSKYYYDNTYDNETKTSH